MTDEPKDDLPKATHESVQYYYGIAIRTYVLDDGRRIINADDFHKLMDTMGLTPPHEKQP
jgi:hypothetical protein